MKKYIKSNDVIIADSDDDAAYDAWLDEIQNNSAYIELADTAAKYGYNIGWAYQDEKGRLSIHISPDRSNRYLPELYITSSSGMRDATVNGDIGVKVQTTSFGSLDSVEYAKYVNAVKSAQHFALFLESYNKYSELTVYSD